jgi:hypothetical protein
MRTRSETGEGKLSGLIWLVAFGALGYAAWNVAPVYFANYSLQDKMIEVARLNRSLNPDEKIVDILMKEIRELDLAPYVQRTDLKILTEEHRRRIWAEYDREAQVLPGWRKNFHFKVEADQPLVF